MKNNSKKSGPESVESTEPELFEKVVHINRCAKVVKGGRRFSFAALVVVGDQSGNVGFGYGKAQMVPDAIRKGTDQAKKAMRHVSISGDTLPHPVLGTHDGGKVMLRPAREGTGIIAGGGGRAHGVALHATRHGERSRHLYACLLYTSPSPRDTMSSRMPSSA